METRQDNRSLGELFSELTREMSTLVRQEVALAKTEMTTKMSSMGKNVGLMVGGGLVLYAGFLSLIAFAIIALSLAMPLWGAALLVTALVLAIGAFLVWFGREHMKRVDMAPRQTVETLKEDARWMREQTT